MSTDLFSTVLEVDFQDDHLHGEPRADLADLVNRPEINHLNYPRLKTVYMVSHINLKI